MDDDIKPADGEQKEAQEPAVLCPLCQSEIGPDANFCAYCGKQLHRGDSGAKRWIGYLALVVMIIAAGVYFWPRPPAPQPERASVSRSFEPPAASRPPPAAIPAPAADKEPVVPAAPPDLQVMIGTVVLNDITGAELVRIPAAVLAGGWVALPKRGCLGGYDWQFQIDDRPPAPIEEGIAADEDDAGLWRLRAGPQIETAELGAWRPDRPVSWIGLFDTEASEPEPVTVAAVDRGTNFTRVQTGRDVSEFGLFIQDERVVGWTFGELAEGGFVWVGPEESGRIADLRVDDFYRISFANSREEEFLRALSPAVEYTDLERLALLAGAFRFESRIDPKDLPAEIQPAAVIERMRALVNSAVEAGLASEAAAQFDAETLSRAADPDLLMDVVRSAASGSGVQNALGLLENTLELMPAAAPGDMDRLERMQAELYRRWLTDLIEAQDFLTAAEAFEDGRQQFPDDLGIHLLGVRLALAQNDWSEAERLLAMKAYPPDFSTAVAGLRERIFELKARAGSIVIQFTPGSNQIPVEAALEVGVRQQFIIDTGASMVTIPSETARELGLIINVRSPRRTVYTAGGAIAAPEVVLPAIAIDGWEVRNIRALVVDLPDQPGWGLLGMNYLRRFRMDLKTNDGLLVLEPR